ncbi:MAG TPA: hypothetical protein VGF00_01930, partial [Acidimicrobiia bacterium]
MRRTLTFVARGAALLLLATSASVAGSTPTSASASASGRSSGVQVTPAPFTATASAMGTRIKITIPGGPLTDTPVDAGGPTAQATLDSLGTSQGYAAFPDPGAFVLSVPGLV